MSETADMVRAAAAMTENLKSYLQKDGPRIFAVFIWFLCGAAVLRHVALKLALRIAYKGNKGALLVLKMIGGKKPSLFAFQDMLPNLPVPQLKDTLRKWLESVEHLVSEEDFRKAQAAAAELEASAEGTRLQRILKKRAATQDNWLAEWWLEFAYLRQRAPLPANVSFFCTDSYRNLLGSMEPVEKDPVRRAATLISALMNFRHLVETGQLRPLRVGGVLPICMDSFRECFGTTRIPGQEIDRIVTHSIPPDGSAHVLLMVGSCLFRLPVIVQGKRVSTEHIQAAIQDAIDDADARPASVFGASRYADPPIALLTSRERTKWARAREQLVGAGGVNAESMQAAEEALFGVTILDKPSGLAEAHRRSDKVDCMQDVIDPYVRDGLLGCDGSKVWFDKCFSLLVYSDARVAWHFEHSYADAPINGLMSEHGLVYSNDITRLYREYQTPFVPEYSRKVPVVPLRWQHPNLPAMLADARNEFSATVSNFACKPLYFAAFGVDRVKRAKISPDAFCQAVLQVSSIGYFGRPVLTYESAALRSFKKGRTETIRSASKKLVNFARDFLDASAGGRKVAPDAKPRLAAQLRAAGEQHVRLARAAGRFEGCDRHLLGLKLAAITSGEKVPALFATAAWNLEFTLSTSQSPILQEHTRIPLGTELYTLGGGFGPVADPGIGCSYHVLPDRLYFYVSARAPDADAAVDDFRARIRSALVGLIELLE